jgi:uncharacterized protein involved in exopolysaccharide biosynthesis
VPTYEASTQLIIEKDARRATSLDTVLQDHESWYQDDFYPTQYRILQSRTLAVRTAQALASAPPEVVPPPPGLSFSISGLVSAGFSAISSLASPSAPAAPADSGGGSAEATASAATAALANRLLGGLVVTPVRNSRLVDVKFRSPDPGFAAAAANAVAAQYIEQSLDFRQSATTQAGAFLNRQLE